MTAVVVVTFLIAELLNHVLIRLWSSPESATFLGDTTRPQA